MMSDVFASRNVRPSAALGARDAGRELAGGQLTYGLGDDPPLAVEVVRLGQADYPVGVVDRAASRPKGDVVDAMPGEESLRIRAEIVHVESYEDDLATVCASSSRQVRSLGTASRAPRRPEIENSRHAAELL